MPKLTRTILKNSVSRSGVASKRWVNAPAPCDAKHTQGATAEGNMVMPIKAKATPTR